MSSFSGREPSKEARFRSPSTGGLFGSVAKKAKLSVVSSPKPSKGNSDVLLHDSPPLASQEVVWDELNFRAPTAGGQRKRGQSTVPTAERSPLTVRVVAPSSIASTKSQGSASFSFSSSRARSTLGSTKSSTRSTKSTGVTKWFEKTTPSPASKGPSPSEDDHSEFAPPGSGLATFAAIAAAAPDSVDSKTERKRSKSNPFAITPIRQNKSEMKGSTQLGSALKSKTASPLSSMLQKLEYVVAQSSSQEKEKGPIQLDDGSHPSFKQDLHTEKENPKIHAPGPQVPATRTPLGSRKPPTTPRRKAEPSATWGVKLPTPRQNRLADDKQGMALSAKEEVVKEEKNVKDEPEKEIFETPVKRPDGKPNITDSPPDSDDFFDFGVNADELLELDLDSLKKDVKQKYTRVLVLEVEEAVGDTGRQELVLRGLQDESEVCLYVRESWASTDVQAGDYVNIVWTSDSAGISGGRAVVDDTNNILIVQPDTLVSGSRIGESFSCMRKTILSERIKGRDSTEATLTGQILHELFQALVRDRDFSNENIEAQSARLVKANIQNMHSVNMSDTDAMTDIRSVAKEMQEWARKYMPSCHVGNNAQLGRPAQPIQLYVNDVLDIEESVWSPSYGLKGKVDMSVELTTKWENGETESKIVPFEIKTNKRVTQPTATSHHAQVTLYTMLMSDRYVDPIDSGLLYYLRNNSMKPVNASRAEKIGLVQQRNTYARYMSSFSSIPPVIRNPRQCGTCYAADKCALYHKALENGDTESAGMGEVFDIKTSHLKPSHLKYFKHWDNLLNIESSNLESYKREIWTMSGPEREKEGRCIANLVLDEVDETPSRSRILTTFTRAEGGSFGNVRIAVGDYILVGTQDGHVALAAGFVSKIMINTVAVVIDKNLRRFEQRWKSANPSLRWRIDKDEISGSFGLVRGSLVSLFVGKKEGDQGNEKIRSLVVDLRAPRFNRLSKAASSVIDGISGMNHDQHEAMIKVLSAQDYALILGMPGTGKTTTISQLISIAVKLHMRVLISSYTHSAVDNILLKLKENGVDFLRLGRADQIHPSIVDMSLDHSNATSSISELQEFLDSKMVIATTCLGINHPVLSRRFDLCIVDEASQITQPVCLGPLLLADRFVLVGDHYQLPPLVSQAEAKEKGLDVSLFRRLSEAHPQSVVNLRFQYRMNGEIMSVCNAVVYNHRLKCGNGSVAEGRLRLPDFPQNPSEDWVDRAVDPGFPVVFLNTDNVPGPDEKIGETTQNLTEASLVSKIVEALLSYGLPGHQIGVISPYRAQLKVLRKSLEHCADVEISTIDKYQGRDKQAVILSLVRSNSQGRIGDILRDWRRTNVAVTRAKHKLIIVGSKNTFARTYPMGDVIKLASENGWLQDLPHGAQNIQKQFGTRSAMRNGALVIETAENNASKCPKRFKAAPTPILSNILQEANPDH